MNSNKAKTLKDLSKITGFTKSTISRVLNGLGTKYRISEATQVIIKKAAEETNFSFNENARSLRLKKTFTIGLIVPDISNSFFAKIASLIEREARLHNYSIFLCNSDNSTEIEKESLILLQKRKVDGIIISPVGLHYKHLEKSYSNIPLVLIDRYFKETNIPYVTSDDYHGTVEAVKYLINSGHKKIICVQGVNETSLNSNRTSAFKNTIEANGIPLNESMMIGDAFSEENGYLSAKKILKKTKKELPTAILSLSNTITLGVLKALHEDDISIPKDISIISFDEEGYSSLLKTAMTTISQSKTQMGKTAFMMLLEQMESEEKIKQKNILLPTKLIIRDSVKSIH
ncbi:LacI family DNA-binding transcriptional regulator [Polaribacter cellanae]|uniref:LacI family DNA-binding transcriptional regulator n=1 Tax=Polaribacter cellanae TaxID=2818493 RepID=A0A975H9F5_9FLAO|nr:LacI family DNA-binding transcriptional regulator [Polaribacter cellanae]QTE22830.1 LacI family DNA-binding transcriptional regulator [Polaribacter cellanae]